MVFGQAGRGEERGYECGAELVGMSSMLGFPFSFLVHSGGCYLGRPGLGIFDTSGVEDVHDPVVWVRGETVRQVSSE